MRYKTAQHRSAVHSLVVVERALDCCKRNHFVHPLLNERSLPRQRSSRALHTLFARARGNTRGTATPTPRTTRHKAVGRDCLP